MSGIRILLARVGEFLRLRASERDLRQEMAGHLDEAIEEYRRQGMAAADARRAAIRDFGGAAQAQDEYRDLRSFVSIENGLRDLRYVLRTLARTPTLSVTVMLTLALGIGANAAIVGVIHAVLLKPLPYVAADEIYSVEVVVPERREQMPSLPPTVQAFHQWRDAETTFSEVAALKPWEVNLTGDGEPERLGGARVSANFFSFLGVPLALGRGFRADEEQPGRDRVVVISDALWRRRYDADPAVVGQAITIGEESHAIVGVASASALMPVGTLLHPLLPFASAIDVWKPIAPTARELKSESWDHGVLVRLPRRASLDQGNAELAALLNEWLRVQMPGVQTQVSTRLVPIREIYSGSVRTPLLLILAAATLLLFTAAASIANVLLARVATRRQEFATRRALGAGGGRITGQVLIEALVLAIGGGLLAAVVARYGAIALAAYGPGDLRLLASTPAGPWHWAFALLLSTFVGVCCGLSPAWLASRQGSVLIAEKDARSGVGNRQAERSRQVLVTLQMALATMLLAASGLLLHSFVNLVHADRGYETERILSVDLSPFGERYEAASSRVAFYGELERRVRALPGVRDVGAIDNLPAISAADGVDRRAVIFRATDTDLARLVLARPVAMNRSVTAGYFAASGTRLRAGRLFDANEPAPVAVISTSLATRLWPGEEPSSVVGRRLRQGYVNGALVEVVGVVADTQPAAMPRDAAPEIYRPYEQWTSAPMTMVIRTTQEPSTLAAAVRSAIRTMDPNLPIPAMRTMREIVSATVAAQRFQMTLTSTFAVVALLLGTVGLYGVVSYAVACRTREIGLRIALGAERRDVMRWVCSSGMKPVAIGLAAGIAGAVSAAAALRSLLFEITPFDPLALTTVVAALLIASGAACYLPARRAAALDPMRALRQG